jgi:hypothetical protein
MGQEVRGPQAALHSLTRTDCDVSLVLHLATIQLQRQQLTQLLNLPEAAWNNRYLVNRQRYSS